MRIEEQVARALQDIAREVGKIRRILESGKHGDTGERTETTNGAIRCPWNGAFCTECRDEECKYTTDRD